MFKELILVVFVDVSQYKFIILWNIAVAPFAGAWIEIPLITSISLVYIGRSLRGSVDWNWWISDWIRKSGVAPFAGAWIEIIRIIKDIYAKLVAPFAGAWIEIAHPGSSYTTADVAPFAGAWIEISFFHFHCCSSLSLPSRERGLKSTDCRRCIQ